MVEVSENLVENKDKVEKYGNNINYIKSWLIHLFCPFWYTGRPLRKFVLFQ